MMVGDVMSRIIDFVEPHQSIAEVARLMTEHDHGAVPVLSHGHLVGIVTDRDLVVRGLAEGHPASAPVSTVMTAGVTRCRPEDDVEEALRIMAEQQIRRLIVCDPKGRMLGLVSLADLARRAHRDEEVSRALADICMPLGGHCQSLPAVA